MGRRFSKAIGYIINSALAIIYGTDDKCLLCGEYEDEDYICESCKTNINIINLRYKIEKGSKQVDCYSLGFYSYGLKKLILAFKYDKDFLAGKVLSKYMSEFVLNELNKEIDMLTFIPSSKVSLTKRGFNQCEVLCEFISKGCSIPYENLIYKLVESKDQIGLDNKKRWDNVRDSFKVKSNKSLEGKSILLIDDVITSGATGFYAAMALKEAKVKEVFILTVAKSRV